MRNTNCAFAQLANYFAQRPPLLNSQILINHRPGFSTETALMKITNDLLTAFDKNGFTALAVNDMSAVFDAINHITLLSRLLKLCGIRGSVQNWFDSFLKGRCQIVLNDNFVSHFFILTSRVPQGSVLASYLVKFHLKPLTDIITNFGFSYHIYADDV